MPSDFIQLEGVRVNNLQNVSVQICRNSLTVICGVSGSGKSSLAFDTLFAEGQRRYVETFSPYARQYLDRIERPDADRIDGIPPAIAVRQNSRGHSSHSTIGTRSEVQDYLRVIFEKAGRRVCDACGESVVTFTPDTVADSLTASGAGERAMLIVDPAESGATAGDLLRDGFSRAIIGDETTTLDSRYSADQPLPDGTRIVVDRVRTDEAARTRIAESVEQLFGSGFQRIEALIAGSSAEDSERVRTVDGKLWEVKSFSRQPTCLRCGREFAELTTDSFNFHSPLGACPTCEGVGRVSEDSQSDGGAIDVTCPTCRGTRLGTDVLGVRLAGLNIAEAGAVELNELQPWIVAAKADMNPSMVTALGTILRQLTARVALLVDCGLGYLSLSRPMNSLSGGEAQRVVLTTALGSGTVNTLYVLDEPTAGLHALDTEKVIAAVRRLQQAGNTVVVVEHDRDFIRAADDVIEIGPGAGEAGGHIIFRGSPDELCLESSPTAAALTRRADTDTESRPEPRHPVDWLEFTGLHSHNIENLDGRLPLGVICGVTGVSGSGKSSLVVDALYPAVCRTLNRRVEGQHESRIAELRGLQSLENVELLDQKPLQKTRRSVPATIIACFDDIRRLLAQTHEARKRNFKPGMFSFNSAQGGRCENCKGRGVVSVEMQFLADIQTNCEACSGRRFRPDVLEVRYRDRSIAEILEMTAEEAFGFFNGHRRIQQRLNALRQAGLGYIRLGQPAATFSGGESQRLRIAALLAGVPLGDNAAATPAKKPTAAGSTLFILDEPSTGLHVCDISGLMQCLHHLVDIGHSVVVIDHDSEVLRNVDYVVEMGPGAGRRGGRIVAAGRR